MAKRSSKRSNKNVKFNKRSTFLLSLLALALVITVRYYPQITELLSERIHSARPATQPDGIVSLHIIDVGQGDAILLMTPEKEVMLIDTGTAESDTFLVEYIDALGIETLDYLVLTHPHADHIGGAAKILDAFVIEEVLMPDAISTSKTFQTVLEKIDEEGCYMTIPNPNDTCSVGSTVVTVLGPVAAYEELNDMSLVLRVDYGNISFLLTGDAEIPSEKDMLSYHPIGTFDADLLKLGHHGSSTSSSAAWLDAVSPIYAIASCGKDNSYGHPHAETVNAMNERGIKCYRTDLLGSIVFTTDGTTLSSSTVNSRAA